MTPTMKLRWARRTTKQTYDDGNMIEGICLVTTRVLQQWWEYATHDGTAPTGVWRDVPVEDE